MWTKGPKWEVRTIEGTKLTWANGQKSTIHIVSSSEFSLKGSDGKIFTAKLGTDGRIHWSNGSVWNRVLPTTTPASNAVTTSGPFRVVLHDDAEQLGNTTLIQSVQAGEMALQVKSIAGFALGREVVVDAGTAKSEVHTISGFGSMMLSTPLKFSHKAGAPVTELLSVPTVLDDAPSAGALPSSGNSGQSSGDDRWIASSGQSSADDGSAQESSASMRGNMTLLFGIAILCCGCCCILGTALLSRYSSPSTRAFTPRPGAFKKVEKDEHEEDEEAPKETHGKASASKIFSYSSAPQDEIHAHTKVAPMQLAQSPVATPLPEEQLQPQPYLHPSEELMSLPNLNAAQIELLNPSDPYPLENLVQNVVVPPLVQPPETIWMPSGTAVVPVYVPI
jgi:hypothetical protein